MNETTRNPWDREDDISFLEIYNMETQEVRTVKRFDYLIEAPNWTSDGEKLVYNSGGKIYELKIADGTICEIQSGYVNNCNNDHVLSPDGSEIAVSHGTQEDGKSRVYILPINGGTPRLITPLAPSYLHGWSPDGKTLAYCAERNGEYDVYTIPKEGGVETQLTDVAGLNDGCEYSPDGEYIWFNSVRTGLMQAWRMKKDGTEQTQMTFDEDWNTWFPHISPDNQKVAMISYKKGDLEPGEHLPHKYVELRTMNADGTDVKTVLELFGGQGTINVNSWSPDSKEFAFVRYELAERS